MKRAFRLMSAFVLLLAMVLQPTANLPFTSRSNELSTAEAAGTPGACLVANGFNVNNPSCNANDVSLSTPTVTIINGCNGNPGDTATFELYSTIVVTSQTRHDIGFWLSTNGGSPINGTSCQAGYLPTGNGSCGSLSQGTHTNKFIGQFTVQCIDTDNDGYLNVPVVTTWSSNDDPSCNNAYETIPSSSSKCKFSNNLSIPVPVPVACTKTSSAN